MSLSLGQFTDALARSGLMQAPEVGSFVESLPLEERPQDGLDLAARLCKVGKLTPYQTEALAKGEVKGLVYGDYTVLEKIGAGGMGQVFKAVHRRMKRLVAIKTLPPATTESEKALKRFYREVEAAAKLAHPNIVAAYDAGEWQGVHYLVMEYVDGHDLAHVLRERGTLPLGEAVGVLVQAAAGLEHAHAQGVYHRDIKLANLLVDKLGVVKVLDMGIARVQALVDTDSAEDGALDGLTKTNQMLGTVEYVAPEQAKNAKVADHRSDIYSLGCCLYKLLAGKPPYSGDSAFMTLMAHMKDPIPSLREAQPDTPEALEKVFRRMMAKQPADRYQSMTEVIGALLGCGISVRLPAAATGGAMLMRAAEGSGIEPKPAGLDVASDAGTVSRAKPDQGTPPGVDGVKVAAPARPAPAAAAATAAPAATAVSPAPAGPPAWRVWMARGKKLENRIAAQLVRGWNWTKSRTQAAWAFCRQWRTRRPDWAQKVDGAQARTAQSLQTLRASLRTKKSAWLSAHPNWSEGKLNAVLAGGSASLFLLIVLVPWMLSGGRPSDTVVADEGSTQPKEGPEAWMDQVVANLSRDRAPAVTHAGSTLELAPAATPVDPCGDGVLEGLDESARVATSALLPRKQAKDSEWMLAYALGDGRVQTTPTPGGPNEIARTHKPVALPEIAGRPVDESLDLLRLLDVRRDTVFGTWNYNGSELNGQHPPVAIGQPATQRPISVLLRFTPPPAFDLVIVASRRAGNGPLLVSMPVEMEGVGKLPTFVFGAEPRREFGNEVPAAPLIKNATLVKLLMKVRPNGMAAEVGGVRVDPSMLVDSQIDASFRHADDVVFRLGSYASSWRILEFSLLPESEMAETVKLPRTNIRALGESQLQPGGQPQPQPPPRRNPLSPESGQLPIDPVRELFPDFPGSGGGGKGFGKGFGNGKGKGK